jgi:hypothetical protein
MVMENFFAPPALFLLLLSIAGCAAPACRPVADRQPIAVPAPAHVQAAPPAPAEPGYLHASGGAFY